MVRWAFESKKGNVSEPFSIGDQFVVAVVDKVANRHGTLEGSPGFGVKFAIADC